MIERIIDTCDINIKVHKQGVVTQPVILALRRQNLVDLCEFGDSLIYIRVPGQPGSHKLSQNQTKINQQKQKRKEEQWR